MTRPPSPARTWATTELDSFKLDQQSLEYFKRYASNYFQNEFIPGQGTEHVLDTLADLGPVRRWLDLGAGPSTLFWSIPLIEVEDIHCADASPEALTVLRNFVRSDGPLPLCYRQVLDRYHRDETHLRRMRGRVRGYHVFDVTKEWPQEFDKGNFDLITEFGLFGLSSDCNIYRRCFQRLAGHMPECGRAVGVDWVRSAAFIASEKHDNTYLTEDLIRESISGAGLDLLTLRWCQITGDDLYDALIVWSATCT